MTLAEKFLLLTLGMLCLSGVFIAFDTGGFRRLLAIAVGIFFVLGGFVIGMFIDGVFKK